MGIVLPNQAPPVDRSHRRVTIAPVVPRGAPPPAPPPHGLADTQERYSPKVSDTLIMRDHTPWYPVQHYTPPGKAGINWAEAGPALPSLRQRNVTINPMVGNSNTRQLQNPLAPGHGLHTEFPDNWHTAKTHTRYLLDDSAKIQPWRQNRLSPSRYTGQSYSQTTEVQGAVR